MPTTASGVANPALSQFVSFGSPRVLLSVRTPIYTSSAEDFLSFAIDDFAQASLRGMTNALSNCKRALSHRVDSLLFLSGLRGFATSGNWPLPKRLKKLEEVGYPASSALHNAVAQPRNDLEHRYEIPRDTQKLTAIIGLTQKFLEGTVGFLEPGPLRLAVFSRSARPRFRHKSHLSDGTTVVLYSLELESLEIRSADGSSGALPISELGPGLMTRMARQALNARSDPGVNCRSFDKEQDFLEYLG
jgi:hypothetical protein